MVLGSAIRLPSFSRKFILHFRHREAQPRNDTDEEQELEQPPPTDWRWVLVSFAYKACRDLLYMVMGLFVFCVPWRSYWLLEGIVQARGELPWCDASALRQVVTAELYSAFRDLPYYGAALVTLCMPWRTFYLLRGAWRLGTGRQTAAQHRQNVLAQFTGALRDVPYYLLGLLVAACPWRGYFLLRDLHRACFQNAPHDEQVRGQLCRSAVLRQAYKALRDMPYYLLGLLAVFFPTRTVWTLKGVWRFWGQPKVSHRLVVALVERHSLPFILSLFISSLD